MSENRRSRKGAGGYDSRLRLRRIEEELERRDKALRQIYIDMIAVLDEIAEEMEEIEILKEEME